MYSVALFDYNNNKIIDLKSPNIKIKGEIYNVLNTININGSKELSFILPLYDNDIENFRWEYIRNELKIQLIEDGIEDWYIIKTLDDERTNDGKLISNIQCKHISSLLMQKGLDKYIDKTDTADKILLDILVNTGWNFGLVDTFRDEKGQVKVRRFQKDKSNTYEMIQELCTLFECYPRFNADKTVDLVNEVGANNGVIFRYKKNLKNIARKGDSNEVVTKLWVEGGSDTTGVVTITPVNPYKEAYILNFGYFLSTGLLTTEQVDAISNYESNITSINNSINSSLTQINTNSNLKIQKEGLLDVKAITKSTKSQLRSEYEQQLKIENDATKKTQLTNFISQLSNELSTLNSEITQLDSEVANLNIQIKNDNDLLIQYYDNKKSTIGNLESLMGDFVREGFWQDSKYVDPQLLYDDAIKLMKDLSFPKISYTLNIIDLSVLTDYAMEKFRIGDTVKIIDEPLKIEDLGKITEIKRNLTNPSQNEVTIANFEGKFEDLFAQIAKSAEIIKQRQEVYERATGINPDGTIKFDILQETFNNNKFKILGGTNNNVQFDSKGITVTDLNDQLKLMRINASGIFLTEDGGTNWKVGMTASGFSAINMTSGTIDTKELQIWNSEEPRFRWSSDGLYAFGDDEDGNMDTNKWIRFNHEGLYFTLDNGLTFEAVWGWNGLFIGRRTAKELNDEIDKVGNDLKDVKTYFDFTDNGLGIGKSDSPLNITISNEQIDFKEDGKIVAYINGQKMYIETLEVLDSLLIGNHRIEKYNDLTLISWAGGN